SFQKNEPLLMTFEKNVETGLTAKEIVNEWAEENLATIIKGYGEEKFAYRIAKMIVEARKKKSIETTTDLVEIIMKATPFYYHYGRIHPATRTFQAIRIAVNDELGAITNGLKEAWRLLAPKGRIAVISFHSLEDRIVKHYFNELKTTENATVITKKPIVASEEEMNVNPRARSAKLRIIEKN
ncbi:MAG TPA: 16S rRNA (cytosine(1402)-N(4))-methyltransferase RsmH, partial [Candidatus Nanoarchaeia archaeon]|nr:16S rRNA (cytosine(1402)-N(4))-methyltransferase RsmH [Candidatus Nanoarchaeia archaeon]